MAPSPALTPTWKSTSWNRSALGTKVGGGAGGGKTGAGAGAGGAGGEDVERSPELKPGGDQHGDDFDEQVWWTVRMSGLRGGSNPGFVFPSRFPATLTATPVA